MPTVTVCGMMDFKKGLKVLEQDTNSKVKLEDQVNQSEN
jgi:hypothetical protein